MGEPTQPVSHAISSCVASITTHYTRTYHNVSAVHGRVHRRPHALPELALERVWVLQVGRLVALRSCERLELAHLHALALDQVDVEHALLAGHVLAHWACHGARALELCWVVLACEPAGWWHNLAPHVR